MPAKIAVVYYSATGTCHALAEAVAIGAEEAGATVRLRRVAELAPRQAVEANPAWRAHHDLVAGRVDQARHDDLRWADGLALGSPTRFGNIAAQLKQFIDTCGPLWAAGELSNKTATAFTSSDEPHGGQESTLLALYNTLHHWGAVIVSPGYTDDAVNAAGGNPYGTSATVKGTAEQRTAALAAARYQGRRLAQITARLVSRDPVMSTAGPQ